MVLTSEQRDCYERCISDDLVMITGDLSEDNLHNVLLSRFREGDIYTFIGSVLISVNPYKQIKKKGTPLYCEDVARHYSKSVSAELAPHIFSIASDAYVHLKNFDKNQTIVVTGESGAGKTEAAKSLMSYLTFQSSQEVEEQHFNLSDAHTNLEEAKHTTAGRKQSQHIVGTAGLTKFEVLEKERLMLPGDKLQRALRLLAERDKVAKQEKKKGRRATGAGVGEDDKLLSYFNSKSRGTNAAGEKTVTGSSVFLSLPHLQDLQRDKVLRADFLQAVCAHIEQEQGQEEGQGGGTQWSFAVFMRALQLAEVEVMHTDPLRKKSRKFSNFHYDDQFVVKMEFETNPLKLNALNELKSQLLESNPVLEMFGNSKTLRNDNSSRFGKYMELQFDPGFSLVGGKLTTYLLEKARLVHQVPGERNFHIMHVFTEGSSPEEKEKFLLEPRPDQYFYLLNAYASSESDFATVASQKLKALQTSLQKVGIAQHRIEDIFFLLSGILSIGNLIFDHPSDSDEDEEGGGGGGGDDRQGPMKVVNDEELDKCASLLCVEPEELEAALVKHKFYQGNDTSSSGAQTQPGTQTTRPRKNTMATSHHSREGANSIRDSLAKEIYNRLFMWIVQTINENIDYTKANKRTVGILDIYGFEIFEINGFEQLCINWCNEKLQAFFIDHTIRAEQSEYDNEGIPWTPIDYFDNAVVLSLIEKKPGIISLLDDQNATKNTTAGKFAQTLESTLHANAYFITPQMSKIKTGSKGNTGNSGGSSGSGGMFGVKHYAGVVFYATEHFAEKNNDLLVNDLLKLMASSKSTFISKLFQDQRTEAEKLKKPPTLGTQFRKDLSSLVGALSLCKPHYVRCLKPNEDKSPKGFDRHKVIHQVQYLGLLENIKVRRAGYCYREDFGTFVTRFGMISSLTWPPGGGGRGGGAPSVSDSEKVLLLLTGGRPTVWRHTPPLGREQQQLQENTDFRMGLSKVFVKEPHVLVQLERDRRLAVGALTTRVQAMVRGKPQLQRYRVIRRGFVLCQAKMRCFLGVRHFKKTMIDIVRLQCLVRRFIERCRYREMFARFLGKPPRVYALKMQKIARGLLAKALMRRTNPQLFAALQLIMEHIRTDVARRAAQIQIAAQARGRKERKALLKKKMASNKIRFCILVKLRWLRKERRIAKAVAAAVATWRSEEGMRVFKCRANGTKAVEKVFRLAKDKENVLTWNAGMMSKMKAGVELHQGTMILQGGHTFKNEDVERETMALNIKNNPFKQNDLRLKEEQAVKLKQQHSSNSNSNSNKQQQHQGGGGGEQPRESEFRREEMVQRSVTIANPSSQQELVLVLDSPEQRDSLFTVLRRVAARFPAPAPPPLPLPSAGK